MNTNGSGALAAGTITVADLRARWRVTPTAPPDPPTRTPAEVVAAAGLVVCGAAGGVGASTLALALAEALGGGLVDCAATASSGLVEVCDRELGVGEDGWVRGSRGRLTVFRSPQLLPTRPADLPEFPTASGAVSPVVVDAGWDALVLADAPGWLPELARDPSVPLVLVAACTVPSLRRAEVALSLLDASTRRVLVAVTGLRGRRWPRHIPLPPTLATALRDGRLVGVPPLDALGVRGLTTAPLPAALAASARQLLEGLHR